MRVLITGGPTWIKVDDIRIFTTFFTGKTALFLARKFKDAAKDVTLLINPHCIEKIEEDLYPITFRYFDEFKRIIFDILKKNTYNLIIHSAAVSDYRLKRVFRGKIPSSKDRIKLELIPTEKIIKRIRDLAKKAILVQFKLEIERRNLIERAYRSLLENNSDFVVANALEDLERGYRAFIIDRDKNVIKINSKEELFLNLNKLL